MLDILENDDGFDYFAQTLVHDWGPLGYLIFWINNVSDAPNKATITRVFNDQVEWLITNGTRKEQEKAQYLKKQFRTIHTCDCRDSVGLRLLHGLLLQTIHTCDYRDFVSCTVHLLRTIHTCDCRDSVGLRLLHGLLLQTTHTCDCGDSVGLRLLHGTLATDGSYCMTHIDSQKGGRMYNFWGDEMLAKRLIDIEKNAPTRIHGFPAQHTSFANRILTERNNTLGSNLFNLSNNNVINPSDKVKRSQGNEKSSCKDNLNEDALVESIDENILDQENILPKASGDNNLKDRRKNLDSRIVEAFYEYQKTIPKTRRKAYLIVNKLRKKTMQLSQDFANKISWKTMPSNNNLREYFDNNCEKTIDDNPDINKLDEELKMSTMFSLFRGIFTSDRIKIAWGEIQALPTKYARNEKENPFKRARVGRRVDMKSTLIKTSNKFEVIYGEVSGGLGPHGIPTACRKKRFLDKIKLMIIMRDSINSLLKECKYTSFEKRTNLIIYGWLQFGLEINFYAMDWSGAGIYRFGLIDQCRLPSDEDEFGILEDAFCIFKLLEYKSLDIEKVVKQLFLENTKGKRRQITSEIEAELNENRSPER
ncbi:13899_t:CDS:10 [Cetraspora pellucida]|uniref:13899_t:CDS:1 n=1 Tax=Cetraspora pellucida TaxID=1433469 RepID=A0A9N8VP66_9GLOM|nr:13899_t:CDS:10 [Cetraspora pellucida]